MKSWLCMMVLVAGCLPAGAQTPGFELTGISSALVPVTVDKMTNIIFPQGIRTGVKVSRDILAQKVRGVENVIELKAVRKNFTGTNLSVYGQDGRLYSFVLRYVEDTAVLNFRVEAGGSFAPVLLSGLPANEVILRRDEYLLCGRRPFLRLSSRSEKMRLQLRGIYLKDSLQWLVFGCSNRSGIAYRPRYTRFFLEDRRRVKRKAVQEVTLPAVYNGLPGEVVSRVEFGAGFVPFTIPAGKRLVVQMAGQDGRMVELRVKGKMVLRGRRV